MSVQLTLPNPEDSELPGDGQDQRVDPDERDGGHDVDCPYRHESIVGPLYSRPESSCFHRNSDTLRAPESSGEQGDRITDHFLRPAGDASSLGSSPDSLRTTDEQELSAEHGQEAVDGEHRVPEPVGDPKMLHKAKDESRGLGGRQKQEGIRRKA